MNIRKLALAAALALLPLLTQAHTHLENSMPKANSSGAAPEHIMLEFNETTQLTALTLQKEGAGDAQKVGPLPDKPEKMIHVAAPKLEPELEEELELELLEPGLELELELLELLEIGLDELELDDELVLDDELELDGQSPE